MLSDRQRDVMFRVLVGVTNKAIGLQLDISVKTVEKHRQEVHRRTKTPTLPDLVRLNILAERAMGTAFGPTSDNFPDLEAGSLRAG